MQATVGLLVAKTLTNATANPFLAGGAGSYNPVLALDVFLVQVSSGQVFACSILGHIHPSAHGWGHQHRVPFGVALCHLSPGGSADRRRFLCN